MKTLPKMRMLIPAFHSTPPYSCSCLGQTLIPGLWLRHCSKLTKMLLDWASHFCSFQVHVWDQVCSFMGLS